MSQLFKWLIYFVGLILSVQGYLDFAGSTWADLIDLAKKTGLEYILKSPLSALVTATGLFLLWKQYGSRHRALYVRKTSMTIVFETNHPDKTNLEFEQILQAYTDNVTAMYSNYNPDPIHGEIPDSGIRMTIAADKNWVTRANVFRNQQVFLEPRGKGWEVRHEFGEALKPCYGIRGFRQFKRNGTVNHINCHNLNKDYHEFCTERYQVGYLKMSIAVPASITNMKVTGMMLHSHASISVDISTDHNARPGYIVYTLEDNPPSNIITRYRIVWEKI